MTGKLRVIVIGAGAFGGWSALMLQRAGAEVLLVDAWGPGHARASSGGPTRVLRLSYPSLAHLRLARRARELWLEEEQRSGRRLFHPIGLLWMAPIFGAPEQAVMANLQAEGVPFARLDRRALAAAYPQIRTDDIEGALLEPGAGYLLAAEACRAVVAALLAEGGTYRTAWAVPGPIRGGELSGLELSDGSRPTADAYVFAGGPWLGTDFGGRSGDLLRVTRQEVFTFGTPPGDARFDPGPLPVWAVRGDRFWYGIPGDGPVGGFKLADDTRGPAFDPTRGDRSPGEEELARARAFLADRFPGLAGAPLISSRVCQYTDTPDGRFLADRHSEAWNAWIVGGGSGHGFKHGPAVGEYLAGLVRGERTADSDPAFRGFAAPQS
jgi:glycine/D-amino acid oxidase-like deaminating enzyme